MQGSIADGMAEKMPDGMAEKMPDRMPEKPNEMPESNVRAGI